MEPPGLITIIESGFTTFYWSPIIKHKGYVYGYGYNYAMAMAKAMAMAIAMAMAMAMAMDIDVDMHRAALCKKVPA